MSPLQLDLYGHVRSLANFTEIEASCHLKTIRGQNTKEGQTWAKNQARSFYYYTQNSGIARIVRHFADPDPHTGIDACKLDRVLSELWTSCHPQAEVLPLENPSEIQSIQHTDRQELHALNTRMETIAAGIAMLFSRVERGNA